MNSDRIAQCWLFERFEHSGAIPLESIFIHQRKILAVELALDDAIRFLEDEVTRVARNPQSRVAIGIFDDILRGHPLAIVAHEATHAPHARIVGTRRDEVEIILVEGAFEVRFA